MHTELLKQISTTLNKTKVVNLSRIVNEQQFALDDLVELSFYPEKKIAFRAAWLLEVAFLSDRLKYLNDIDYIILRMKDVRHASCQRHYAKIMMHITSPHAPAALREKIKGIDLEPVIEQCFDWMIDPKVLIAVKAHASEVLFNLRHRYPWVVDELSNQLKYLMRDGTAAIQSKGRRLLGYLAPGQAPLPYNGK